eukprot:8510189-Pyramimonas_sp.AAC.1
MPFRFNHWSIELSSRIFADTTCSCRALALGKGGSVASGEGGYLHKVTKPMSGCYIQYSGEGCYIQYSGEGSGDAHR